MKLKLVDLQEKDYDAIKEIYNHYVVNSTVTFHTVPVSVPELKRMIPADHPKYKSFVIQSGDLTCGYCYLSPFNPRQAYDRTAEVTIYLKPEFRGKGIGKEILDRLEQVAKHKGICVLIGIITAENHSSIMLFEKSGYEKSAHFKQVGQKFNRLLDVVAYQKIIQ